MAGVPEVLNETCYQPGKDHSTLFLLFIELMVGLPGNVVALWLFCFRIKSWKPHTLYLFNIVLADFLLLVSLPFRIDNDLRGENWVFGDVWCRINLFMLAVNRSASIIFMTAVALDRYFKVLHPHHRVSCINLTQAGRLAGVMWAVVIALRIPLLTIKLRQSGNSSLCRSFDCYDVTPLAIWVHYLVYFIEFILPWMLVLYSSARISFFLCRQKKAQQKRVKKAIIAVAVITLVFTICFLPAVVTGLACLCVKNFYPDDKELNKYTIRLFINSLRLTYLNSALDPIIYTFSSSMFCQVLKSSLCQLGFRKKTDGSNSE